AERSEVAVSLRRDETSEREAHRRDLDVGRWLIRHLDEGAGVRPPFVELSGRVQEAGAEADGDGDLVAVAELRPDGLQSPRVLVGRRDIGLDRDVARRFDAVEE